MEEEKSQADIGLEEMYAKLEADTDEGTEPEGEETVKTPPPDGDEQTVTDPGAPLEAEVELSGLDPDTSNPESSPAEKEKGEPERSELEVMTKRYHDLWAHSTKASMEAADLRRQVGGYTKQLEDMQEQLAAVPRVLSDEEKGLAEEYPELAPRIFDIMDKRSEAERKNAEERFNNIERQSEAVRAEEFHRALATEHSDLSEVLFSKSFEQWRAINTSITSGQKEAALHSADPMEASALVSQFKREHKEMRERLVAREAKPSTETITAAKDAAEATIIPKEKRTSHFGLSIRKPSAEFTLDQVKNMTTAEYDAKRDAIFKSLEGVAV